MKPNPPNWTEKFLLICILAGLLLTNIYVLSAQPTGPVIDYLYAENKTPDPALELATAGGSFTTLRLNLTSQSMRWKAYVGNISGRFTLDDAMNYTIYDWQVQNIVGEVYVSRNNSVSWVDARCADDDIIGQEMGLLNHTNLMSDSLNNTFNRTVHKEFFVGAKRINSSSCPSIATYINDTSQAIGEDALFQQVLLRDDSSLVYAGILEDRVYGYDYKLYDFQIIVAENEIDGPTTYYFWVELS